MSGVGCLFAVPVELVALPTGKKLPLGGYVRFQVSTNGGRRRPFGPVLLRVVGCRPSGSGVGRPPGMEGRRRTSLKEGKRGRRTLSYGDLGTAWWCGVIECDGRVLRERVRVYWFGAAHEAVEREDSLEVVSMRVRTARSRRRSRVVVASVRAMLKGGQGGSPPRWGGGWGR